MGKEEEARKIRDIASLVLHKVSARLLALSEFFFFFSRRISEISVLFVERTPTQRSPLSFEICRAHLCWMLWLFQHLVEILDIFHRQDRTNLVHFRRTTVHIFDNCRSIRQSVNRDCLVQTVWAMTLAHHGLDTKRDILQDEELWKRENRHAHVTNAQRAECSAHDSILPNRSYR